MQILQMQISNIRIPLILTQTLSLILKLTQTLTLPMTYGDNLHNISALSHVRHPHLHIRIIQELCGLRVADIVCGEIFVADMVFPRL